MKSKVRSYRQTGHLFFITCCGPGYGMGHLVRLTCLYEELSIKYRIKFAINNDCLGKVYLTQRDIVFETYTDFKKLILNLKQRPPFDMIIIDVYKFPNKYLNHIIRYNRKVFFLMI